MKTPNGRVVKIIEFVAIFMENGRYRKAMARNHEKKIGYVNSASIVSYTHGKQTYVKTPMKGFRLFISEITERTITLSGKERYTLHRTKKKHSLPTYEGTCNHRKVEIQIKPTVARLSYLN